MLGEVPSGWSESRVDHVAQVVGGMGFPEKYQGRTGLKYPFLKVSDMNSAGNDRLLFTAANTVSEDDLRSLGAHAWPPGTTVFPKVGAALLTNKRRVLAVEAAFDNNVMGLVPREADPWFLYYFMSTVDFAMHVQTGALPSVNQSTVAGIRLLLPPLPEQKKIAAILSSVDEAIQATQAVIDQTRRVKEGLLQDLLTRGIGHTRFKKTEIGEIPEGWEVRKLRTLGLVDCGKAKNITQHYPMRAYLRSANVLDDVIDVSDVHTMPFSDAEFERYKLQPGDILLNEGQSIELVGRPAVYRGDPPDVAMQNALVRWRPEPKVVDPEFAYQTVRYLYQSGEFSRVATQTTSIAHLGLRRFGDLGVAVPPINEQREIAATLGACDTCRRSAEVSRRRLINAKSGLLQDLLTGKVRVTP